MSYITSSELIRETPFLSVFFLVCVSVRKYLSFISFRNLIHIQITGAPIRLRIKRGWFLLVCPSKDVSKYLMIEKHFCVFSVNQAGLIQILKIQNSFSDNRCIEKTCLNGGACVSNETTLNCVCERGFSGEHCGKNDPYCTI